MGLFSSISGLFGASKKKKAVAKAWQNKVDAATAAENRAAQLFGQTQANLQPWVNRGNLAGDAQGDLLGLGGTGEQEAALAALKASPLFESIYRTGEEAVLQNASATGGLRGGNVQHSLANFGADTFARVLQQQLANLGAMSELGARTGVGLGELSGQEAGLEGNLRLKRGEAEYGKVMGKAEADQGILGGIGDVVGSLFGAFPGLGGLGGGLVGKIF